MPDKNKATMHSFVIFTTFQLMEMSSAKMMRFELTDKMMSIYSVKLDVKFMFDISVQKPNNEA